MAIIKPLRPELICVQELAHFDPQPSARTVSMLRLDQIHPLISGNKWFKLRYNLAEAQARSKSALLSFGGAYSNHLIATAAAAHSAGMTAIGIVRGAELATIPRNSVLAECEAYGMHLQFESRAQYAQKDDPLYLNNLALQYPEAYIIPEGGDNAAGRKGAAEIAHYIPDTYTDIVLSVGTGTTFIGLREALSSEQQLWGLAPIKGGAYLKDKIAMALPEVSSDCWSLIDRFHFGGFGKTDDSLMAGMAAFEKTYGFSLDRVYTGKMMLGLKQLLSEQCFAEEARILCIHSGGLTGN